MAKDDEEIQEQSQFELLIQGLLDDKYAFCNDFVRSDTVKGLSANITSLSGAGNMKTAGVGNQTDYQENKLIRSDKIHWIEEQSTNQYEMIYLKKIWRFINHLNNTCFTSINNFESHYASFEKEQFYKRHLDQFKSEKERKFSVVLYLNQAWKKEDGGVLSMYPARGIQKDISPKGGRLVFFRSDEMEHEVHPSFTRNRRSIAGWLKN